MRDLKYDLGFEIETEKMYELASIVLLTAPEKRKMLDEPYSVKKS